MIRKKRKKQTVMIPKREKPTLNDAFSKGRQLSQCFSGATKSLFSLTNLPQKTRERETEKQPKKKKKVQILYTYTIYTPEM